MQWKEAPLIIADAGGEVFKHNPHACGFEDSGFEVHVSNCSRRSCQGDLNMHITMHS